MRVPGEGPKPANVVLVGEAPGFWESQEGRPFVGKSGQELTRYLERAHIRRSECYITNLCKIQPPVVGRKQKGPSKEDIQRDTPELIQELLDCRPRWIGAVGRYAARFLTGLDLGMEESHGLAFPIGARICGLLGAEAGGQSLQWMAKCQVVALYHPAAGLHNPEIQPLVYWDLQQFGKYVTGRLKPVTPVDQHPYPSYIDLTPVPKLDQSLRAYANFGFFPLIGIDTEGLLGSEWSIQFSGRPGTAGALRNVAGSPQFYVLNQWLGEHQEQGTRLIFHNALHDIPICEALGIEIDFDAIEDTMLMLFCLRLLPLGLKAVMRRLLGLTQPQYLEVVGPASTAMALEYIKWAMDVRACRICNGAGKVAAYKAKGKDAGRLLKRQDKCPNPECIDGGLWPAREGELKYDWKTGQWKVSTGWEIGRYLRTMRQDIESGKLALDAGDEDEDNSAEDDGEDKAPRTLRQRFDDWPDDVRVPIEERLGPMPEPTLDDVDLAVALDYACRDADGTLRAFPLIKAMLEELDLWDAYKLDLSIVPVAAEFERNGMHVNCDKLRAVSRKLKSECDVILAQIRHIAGRPLNPASGDQVAALLFGDRKLSYDEEDRRELQPQVAFELQSDKRTKTGKREATDDKVLEGLKLKYAHRPEVVEIVQLILNYRTRHKLITTYADKIPKIVDRSSRVHTHIKLVTAATFRLASGDPINLQNIPIRNKGGADLGRMIRGAFEAPEGRCVGSADYSQVELRVLAALSGDDSLLRAFREGLDPHVLGASRAWRLSYDELYKAYKAGDRKASDIRESAKNLNFGIVFGITPRGLQAQMELRGLKYTLDECAELIHMWIHETFPGIGSYIQEVHDRAKIDGYVRSFCGHIRYAPAVWSLIPNIREEALRQLVNFTIQCSAAEILKHGLKRLWTKKVTLDALDCQLIMSVHDENLTEQPDDEDTKETVAAIVELAMCNPIVLPNGVDITTKMKFARSWGDLK